MPEPCIATEPPTVPEMHCPGCLARMQLAGAETKLGGMVLTFHCDTCKADVVRPLALKHT